MKYLTAFLILSSAARAEIVTVNYQGTVTEVTGLPFGITAVSGVTPIKGVLQYDTATEQFRPDSVTNSSRYVANISSGFVLTIGGVTISSSDYVLSTTNNVTNYGGSDLLVAGSDSDGLEGTTLGDDFRVNGIPWEGNSQLHLVDTDRTLFPTDADVDVLPRASLLGHIDFVWGFLADGLGTGGENANNLIFMGSMIPEPGAILLMAQALLLAGAQRRTSRRSSQSQSPV
jgi:hypothetical protein